MTIPAVSIAVGLLLDPWLSVLDDPGLSFSGTYAPGEVAARLRKVADCSEPTPGATVCRRTEKLGEVEMTSIVTVAEGRAESFVESVNVTFPEEPAGLSGVVREYLDRRYQKLEGGENDWCGGHHIVSMGVDDGRTSLFYWNIFKRETSICRDGGIVKLVPFIIPGGRSKLPPFLGLGNEIDWGILAPDLYAADNEFDRWVSEPAKGKGLGARKDLMLRPADVTYYFNTTAASLSEVQIRFRGLSRPFKDRLADRLKEAFRHHNAFDLENGVVRRGRMCKEDLHVLVSDGPGGFVISMYDNPDGFCVD